MKKLNKILLLTLFVIMTAICPVGIWCTKSLTYEWYDLILRIGLTFIDICIFWLVVFLILSLSEMSRLQIKIEFIKNDMIYRLQKRRRKKLTPEEKETIFSDFNDSHK